MTILTTFRQSLQSGLLVWILWLGLVQTVYAEPESAVIQPKWAELSEAQRSVLSPLAADWDTLRPWQKEKMLDIAHDYPKMSAQRQALIQKRLSIWSRMTPFERENARKRHQQYQALPPEKKAEIRKKWQIYQNLPESEREAYQKQHPDLYGSDAL